MHTKDGCAAVLLKLQTMKIGTFRRPTGVTWVADGAAYLTTMATSTDDQKVLFVTTVTTATLKKLRGAVSKDSAVKKITKKVEAAVCAQFNVLPETFTECVVVCESGTIGDYVLFTLRRTDDNCGLIPLYHLTAARSVLAKYIQHAAPHTDGVSELTTPMRIKLAGPTQRKRPGQFSRVRGTRNNTKNGIFQIHDLK